jgi:large subunit ribosomal protein L2
MGTRIITQRRGRGGPKYRVPSHRFFGVIKYPHTKTKLTGEIIDLINCRGHTAPLALIRFNDNQFGLIPAGLGTRQGQQIEAGEGATPDKGNILKLKDMPTGTQVYNIEKEPFDGGKLVRSSGAAASVVAKTKNIVTLKMPSKKTITLNPECRATIGVIAGGGRPEKPLCKAGNNYKKRRARGKVYPKVAGVAMNACDHPFGGTHRRTKGRPSTTKRSTPPGRKVGLIAAKKTGRGK